MINPVSLRSIRKGSMFLLVKLTGNASRAPGVNNKKIREKGSFQETLVTTEGFRVNFINKKQIAYGCFFKRLDLSCIEHDLMGVFDIWFSVSY